MRFRLRHETVWVHDAPLPYSIQLLHLTPRAHAGLAIECWRVASSRRHRLHTHRDAFGNVAHLHDVPEPHTRIAIVAEGVVETHDTTGLVRDAPEPLPPAFYLRSTPRTAPAPAVAMLAADAKRGADPLDRVERLLGLVHDRLPGGGCRERAHVFVAAARLLGMPARYVEGLLCAPGAGEPRHAGHAWAEVHHAALGWIALDPASGARAGEAHVPCAVGLDADDAAPVRGPRHAPKGDDATVRLRVARLQQQ